MTAPRQGQFQGRIRVDGTRARTFYLTRIVFCAAWLCAWIGMAFCGWKVHYEEVWTDGTTIGGVTGLERDFWRDHMAMAIYCCVGLLLCGLMVHYTRRIFVRIGNRGLWLLLPLLMGSMWHCFVWIRTSIDIEQAVYLIGRGEFAKAKVRLLRGRELPVLYHPNIREIERVWKERLEDRLKGG